MSVRHGSNADVVANGYVLSEFLNTATFGGTRDTGDSTTFKKKSRTYVPGMRDATLSVEGIYDGDPNAADEILNAALGSVSDVVATYFPHGQEEVGAPAYSIVSVSTSYEVNTDVGDIAQNSAEFSAGRNGSIDRGVVVHPRANEADAGFSEVVDNGVSTDEGASLVVHAFSTAVGGSSAFLQDSADGVTWADLAGSIEMPAGRSSQRLAVSGTVRRYVRVRWSAGADFIATINRNN